MLALSKIWSFIRHYWYIPFVAAVALVLFFVVRDKKIVDWGRVLSDSNKAHQAEVEAIERANKEQVEANNRAIKRMQQAEDQIRAEFERNERVLDAAKEKRARKIMRDLKDDPLGMSRELEKELGVRIIVVD